MRDEWNVETGKKGRRRKEMQVQYVFPQTPRALKGKELVS